MKVVYGRKRIELAALEADPEFQALPEPVVALGSGLPEKGLAFAFRDWKELVKFAQRTEAGEKIASMDERRRKLRRRSREDTTALAERLKRRTARIEGELRELAARTGLAIDSKELFLRATTKADPLEGPIFDPAMLFTGLGFTGPALPVAYPGFPNLGWLGFNNLVSSVRVVGLLALFNLTWFGGASRVIVGLPFGNVANLGAFNNIASSCLVD
jgi:hypothetical protein